MPNLGRPRNILVCPPVPWGRGKSAELAEIDPSGASRLESYVEKQLGKMNATPLPLWDTYLWQNQVEADSPKLSVPAGEVRNLSRNLAADGTLTRDVPAGEWIIQRNGMTPTGMKNSPTPFSRSQSGFPLYSPP